MLVGNVVLALPLDQLLQLVQFLWQAPPVFPPRSLLPVGLLLLPLVLLVLPHLAQKQKVG